MTSPHRPKSNAPAIWLAVGVVVLLLGLVAVLATRGSDDEPEMVANQTGDVQVGETTVPQDEAEPDTTEGEVQRETSTTEALESSTPLPTFVGTEDDPAVGMTIPTLSGTDLNGDPMSIGADGKAKVILFVAHWCPHCQAEIPRLVDHLADNPMPDEVELLTVSTAVDPSAPNYPPVEWLDDEGWTAPTLADTSGRVAATHYGLAGFPFFVVADADGKVVFRISGELSVQEFDLLVEAARTGRSPL